MTRSYPFLLGVLAAIWGASYLFIKVGVRDFEPTVLMTLRLLIAAVLLIGFLAVREGAREALTQIRGAWREGLVFGVINGAAPFTLIAWGEKHIDSGVAAIANSSVPIFVAVLAVWFAPSERSTGLRLVGVLLGLAGVAVLAGVHPAGGWMGAAGTGAITLASISYAGANLFAARQMSSMSAPVLAAASFVMAFLLLLPLALLTLPSHAPGWKSVGSGVALGLFGTAIAQVLAYRMVSLYGSSRTVLVAYLLPAFALLYGTVLLGEPVTAQKLAGLALILGGVGLGAGAIRLPRRAAVTPAP